MKEYILIAEDDNDINQMLKELLEQHGYETVQSYAGTEALLYMQQRQPDAVILDLMLPGKSGEDVLREIREKYPKTGVIVASARDEVQARVSLLRQGADDYVVKPFDLEVLYSRIQALLRRTGNVAEQYLSCGGIEIDQNRHTVSCHAEEISLSEAEYRLLLYLMQNKGKTVTREKILEQVWDVNGNYVNNNTLTVTMKRLRDKLYQPECLKTVRSIGYRMEDTI